MSSNKSTLMIIALAVLGGIIFSQVAISPALSFVIGVFASAFVFKFSNTSTEPATVNEPATKTLYVGNLPYKANESHVKELFAKHGEVFAVRLMKDKRTGKRRGFGFVVMAATDAAGAIEGLNDKDYMQRTLKVRIANDPKSQAELD
ncbi:RNA-binding protein [Vibrio sp. Isolate25]|uniref:RNA recognition motif domain-containing protein n=1 Tax=Vibrio TaxID=662 RepID=UPI001EFEB759|nr:MULTISPECIES: RNA-binding protein [Vibrio]MCG9598672.1 RNA-binding protein [Vibrio sp. Isolate25]MCG9680619.1 RNA-binding protein [Vibrio sp. Isolate24]USD32386.1 RNA-binding protein [Vibrio sp. SCSIO 43186]USD45428.1 RNA-binding protein [Vibrio sp. SCSIO 43145]USD69511.1 RNA-binding protein [Vibrio sp. SCSIO 43139]